jgi:PPP family 3-phenylpropionic acid transporter
VERPRLLAISCVWFFALGGLGMFFPFYSLYLSENLGLSGGEIGWVLACLPMIGILAQPVFGHVADRTGSRSRLLSGLALGAGCGYTALALGEGFASMLLLTVLLACFSTPLIPSAMAVTLAVTRERSQHAFGFARTWGTVGFLLAVVAFPSLLDWLEARPGTAPAAPGVSEPALHWMFPLTGGVVALAGLIALALPRTGEVALRAHRGDWRPLLAHGPYRRLLVFAFLAYLTLQGPMGFFPVYVAAHGGSVDTVSRLWVWMLLVEIPLVALSGTSLSRLGARGLLGIGVAAGGVRWLVCGLLPDSPLVHPVQGLHGVVVVGLVIGAPLYVEATVPERLRSTGQGLLAMVGVSLGGIASNVSCGWLLDRYGPDAPYAVSGVAALALAAGLPLLLPRPDRPDDGSAEPALGRSDP